MKIHGAEGMAPIVVRDQIHRGGKFVVYQFCLSFLFITIRKESDIYFIKSDESGFLPGLPYTAVALLAGWWGYPGAPCVQFNRSLPISVEEKILPNRYWRMCILSEKWRYAERAIIDLLIVATPLLSLENGFFINQPFNQSTISTYLRGS